MMRGRKENNGTLQPVEGIKHRDSLSLCRGPKTFVFSSFSQAKKKKKNKDEVILKMDIFLQDRR